MERKVPVYVLLLSLLLSMVVLISFGGILRYEYIGGNKFPILQKTAVFLSEIPQNVRAIFNILKDTNYELPKSKENRFEGKSGFVVHDKNHRSDFFLLLSRSDPEKGKNVVELVDLNNFEKIHTWLANAKQISNSPGYEIWNGDWNEQTTVMASPDVDRNGNLFFLMGSNFVGINLCNEPILVQSDYSFHHTFNEDHEGNYWVIGTKKENRSKPSIPEIYFREGYIDDCLIQMDKKGQIKNEISLTNVFINHEIHNLLFLGRVDEYFNDPLHINDVQPVLKDGKYFSKGQLFISLGHLNMVILLDPITKKILWNTPGFKLFHQHDIDIIGENKVSIFNNNRVIGKIDTVYKNNEIITYDFDNDRYELFVNNHMIANDVRTINQGLHEITSEGVFVEEQNYGRLLFANEKMLVWEYVNRGSDNKLYQVHWSKIITDKKLIYSLKKVLGKKDCH